MKRGLIQRDVAVVLDSGGKSTFRSFILVKVAILQCKIQVKVIHSCTEVLTAKCIKSSHYAE